MQGMLDEGLLSMTLHVNDDLLKTLEAEEKGMPLPPTAGASSRAAEAHAGSSAAAEEGGGLLLPVEEMTAMSIVGAGNEDDEPALRSTRKKGTVPPVPPPGAAAEVAPELSDVAFTAPAADGVAPAADPAVVSVSVVSPRTHNDLLGLMADPPPAMPPAPSLMPPPSCSEDFMAPAAPVPAPAPSTGAVNPFDNVDPFHTVPAQPMAPIPPPQLVQPAPPPAAQDLNLDPFGPR
eukprot:FR739339.1.p1 GENE.FR739339.1~~FR739339.1.p1  ORF type:complete len:243 (+),score=22.12 FR739339.1:29-730(+)